jgi:hypothetical protein
MRRHSKYALMTARGTGGWLNWIRAFRQAGSDWSVKTVFPLALAASEILAAKSCAHHATRTAGLPGNVNEGEDNTDEEELHKVARDQQLLWSWQDSRWGWTSENENEIEIAGSWVFFAIRD